MRSILGVFFNLYINFSYFVYLNYLIHNTKISAKISTNQRRLNMIPLIKFSDIKKNPQELIIKEGHAAIVRYSDVVGFVVEPERMKQLIRAEEMLEDYMDNYKAEQRNNQKRVRVNLEDI